MIKNKPLLRSGLLGAGITALCCFTPILVILFGAVGLSAVIVYLDYVLFPALFGFLALTVFAFYRERDRQAEGNKNTGDNT